MIDVQTYEDVISALEKYEEKVNDGLTQMDTVAGEAVTATNEDAAVSEAKDKLLEVIKKIQDNVKKIEGVVSAMKKEVQDTKDKLEEQRKKLAEI